MAVASLGDEITIPTPESVSGGTEQATAIFIPWLQQRGLTPADIGCNVASGPNSSNWTGCTYNASALIATSNPVLFYWSTIWGYEWAALQMKEFTDITKKYLPNAGVGANFESGDYISESWKWIDVFRHGGLTMPWSEAYVWAWEGGMVGTQQMNELRQDMFQAGVRPNAPVEGNYDHNILCKCTSHHSMNQSSAGWINQAPSF